MTNTDLLIKLCAIPSITGSPQENAVSQFIHKGLSHWAYFIKHPQHMWYEYLIGDKLNRYNFCAMVKAKPATKRTIILMSHHDVVPVDNCKPVNASPFDIKEYTETIAAVDLDSEARADLDSGNWLFGRGVSDMKSGIAAQLALLEEYAAAPDKLRANILLMTLADEENNGAGIHQAVRMLARMQREDGLEYIACIDSEPTISNENKNCGRIYTGTIGNATLFALAVGRSSHVGEYFSGINSTSLISQLVLEIEGDPATADEWMGKRYSPATCLQLEDLSKVYSVTLPEKSAALFNVLMTSKSPREQLDYLNQRATIAIRKALDMLSERRKTLGYEKNADITRVIPYSELVNILKATCDLHKTQQTFLDTLPDDMSDQSRGIALVDHMLQLAKLEGPYIVIGFLSYCQPRVNRRANDGDRALMTAVESVIKYAKEKHNHDILHEEVYEGISDMSELGYQGTIGDLQLLIDNFIGWGTDHNYPFAEMQELNVPIVNLGPIGKDAHKMTERLDRNFYANILPDLLKKLVDELSA